MARITGKRRKIATDEPSLARTFIGKDIRIDVLERHMAGGNLSRMLMVHRFSEDERVWVHIGMVHENDLAEVLELSQQAQEFLSAL